jgi:ATP-binding cassette subfamily G (WHITE) protein 2 (SNQ2)
VELRRPSPPNPDLTTWRPPLLPPQTPSNDLRIDDGKAEKALAAAEKMTDTFSWENLNYKVPITGGGERKLLNDVSGYVVPGKLTALMGESGAGKVRASLSIEYQIELITFGGQTTLLNVLAERTSVGVITGYRFVNGQALPADFQAQTGYCQQMDTHEPTSSVREAILFSAVLRQPQDVPMAEKEAYVEKCLSMCGLEACADAIVGTLGVEQRKRLTIAVELAAKPKLLLFLDEPTSGFDSQSAWAIVSFLRTLADNGQAILCTCVAFVIFYFITDRKIVQDSSTFCRALPSL